MQRFVRTLDLVDDPKLIEFYVNAHKPENFWPEIAAGIKEVGIERMDIYRDGTRLVMILEMPDDVDKDKAFAKLATLPRQQEWEEYVGKAQKCEAGATSDGKWRDMEQYFELP